MSPARIVGGMVLTSLLVWLSSLPVARGWDLAVSVWLQRAAPAPDVPANALVVLGNAEVEISAAVLVGVVLLLARRNSDLGSATLRLGLGLAVASLAAVLLKTLIVHPAPFSWLWRHTWQLGVSFQTPYSFPSGHTLRATLIAGTLLQRTPLAAQALVLAMMAALVYLGNHWTSDVLGGLCLGWTFAEAFRAFTLRERGSAISAASLGRPH
jgi:undecaprenyl-diphosphatase